MTDPAATAPETNGTAPDGGMRVVLKPAEDFAPRTRQATADRLTALRATLDSVKAASPGVFTIVENVSPKESASLVALLNEHYDRKWTFAARTTTDGTAIVQAKYDPANMRPVRTVNRKPKTATAPAAKKTAAARR